MCVYVCSIDPVTITATHWCRQFIPQSSPHRLHMSAVHVFPKYTVLRYSNHTEHEHYSILVAFEPLMAILNNGNASRLSTRTSGSSSAQPHWSDTCANILRSKRKKSSAQRYSSPTGYNEVQLTAQVEFLRHYPRDLSVYTRVYTRIDSFDFFIIFSISF